MDIETTGYSAGGGGILGALVGALTSYFGNKDVKLSQDALKKEFEAHKERVVYRDTCSVCKGDSDKARAEMKEDIRAIRDGQESMNSVLNQLVGELRARRD